LKSSVQLNAKIRNLAKATGINAGILHRNFMLERFLERITVSKYQKNFILKGGVLIASIVGIDTRSTMDLDTTIKGQRLTEDEIIRIVGEILSIHLDDSVEFTLKRIEETLKEADYCGYRVTLEIMFDQSRDVLKIDITTGDAITPQAIEYGYKLMFGDKTINIMAYNLETILAEKFETVISRSVTNTRMKDFYDIFILTSGRNIKFDPRVFAEALKNTSNQRHTQNNLVDADRVIDAIASNPDMAKLWKRYQADNPYVADIAFEAVTTVLRKLSVYITDGYNNYEVN